MLFAALLKIAETHFNSILTIRQILFTIPKVAKKNILKKFTHNQKMPKVFRIFFIQSALESGRSP